MESTKYSTQVYAINSQRDNLDKFKEIIDTTLEKVVKDGIEKEKLLAGLNRIEIFSKRELLNSTTAELNILSGYLIRGFMAKIPMNSLIFDETLSELRDDILNNGLLEKVIHEKILKNNHKAFIVLSPNAGLNDKKDMAQREWLKRYKNSLNDIQKNKENN